MFFIEILCISSIILKKVKHYTKKVDLYNNHIILRVNFIYMTYKFSITLLFCITTSFFSFSQTKKSITTNKINESVTIDADLNEASWKNAEIATDFVMFEPDNGKPIDEKKKTEVKILYDDEAIYVGALLYDDEPAKIMKEITERDDFGTTDAFGIFINGYNDGQQDFRFFLTYRF